MALALYDDYDQTGLGVDEVAVALGCFFDLLYCVESFYSVPRTARSRNYPLPGVRRLVAQGVLDLKYPQFRHQIESGFEEGARLWARSGWPASALPTNEDVDFALDHLVGHGAPEEE